MLIIRVRTIIEAKALCIHSQLSCSDSSTLITAAGITPSINHANKVGGVFILSVGGVLFCQTGMEYRVSVK